MDTRIVRAGDLYRYESSVNGYSTTTHWYTLTGTPTIAADLLVFNEDGAQSLVYSTYGKLEIRASIPTVPTTGDSRFWGFKSEMQGDESRIEFAIVDDEFLIQVYDEAGTLIVSRVCEWNDDWTATQVRWGIRRTERDVYFTADEVLVASITNKDKMSRIPMPHYILNENADDLTVSVVTIYGI